MRSKLLLSLIVLMPMTAYADEGENEKKEFFVVKGVKWVKTLIDSMAMARVDRSYIEQPKKPWAVEVRSETGGNYMKMSSKVPGPDGAFASLTSKTTTGFAASAGLWLGYRGYGLGWSKALTGEGSTFSFGAMGGSFGINLRVNSYRSNQPDMRITYSSKTMDYDEQGRAQLDDPIRVKSVFLDGYYMFNGKHFSYSAAYDQALIQRKSAGSLMAGLMYYHTSVSFDDNSNWPIAVFMKGVGKLKFTQACVGAGYTYNWVPARGWLVNVMVMPMLQFYNRLNATLYRLYYDGVDITDQLEVDFDDPDWDTTEYEDDFDYYKMELREDHEWKTNNRVGFNFDARMSVVYNFPGCYLRFYGFYNRFPFDNDMSDGRLSEWRAFATLGIRF